jgi:O-antigen ligase
MILPVLRRGRLSVSAIAALAIALAVSVASAASALQDRQYIADSAEVRLSLYAEALEAIKDRPLLGHGAGVYSSIQPLYHRSSTPSDLVWDNAHSTVLEIIVTLGIPVAVFGIMVFGFILFRLSQAWWCTTRNASSLLAAIGVCIAVGLHAFVDFSLEIQANALYVASLVGLGMGEAMRIAVQSRQRVPAGEAQMDETAGAKQIG